MIKPLKVLSLFDGMACGLEALKRAGIPVEIYCASEINKHAMAIAKKNHPEIQHIGDVTKLTGWDFVRGFDLVIAGSPCQSISKMGKVNGITTLDGQVIERLEDYLWNRYKGIPMNESALFWEFIRVKQWVEHFNPNAYFLLENVQNKFWEDLITKAVGVPAIPINSSVVSAQNRERNYWTNIPYTPIRDMELSLFDIIPGAIALGTRGRKLKGDDFYTPITTYRTDGKSNCLVRNIYSTGKYQTPKGIFTLSPEQCEVLQTLPVGYTEGVAKTHRYEMIGNGWTVDVLVEGFFKNLLNASELKVDPLRKLLKV